MTEQPSTRIALNPDVLGGKAVVRGTRVAVETVLEWLASGWTVEDLLAEYPQLTREDVAACLAYARDLVRAERVFPSAA